MPKKKRVWYPGATFHIMCRGNRRSDIFRDDEDFQVYLSILEQVKEKFDFLLYSYCLMTNHLHLQLKTNNDAIWEIMRRINLFYTKYFNTKNNFVGHVFQGRYLSELIETDSYNLEISRYIHLNPVKASMVEEPIDYTWSSYPIYMATKDSDLIDEAIILSYFVEKSRERYKEFVESRMISQKNKKEKRKMEVN